MDTGAGQEAAAAAGGLIYLVVMLGIVVFWIAAMWKTVEKAGEPGWSQIVPIYNTYILLRVGGYPGWWLLLFFIPIVSLIPAIMLPFGVAKNFGKGAGFGIGLLLLPIIFYPVLGFGSSQYTG